MKSEIQGKNSVHNILPCVETGKNSRGHIPCDTATDPEIFQGRWLLVLNYAKVWWVVGLGDIRYCCDKYIHDNNIIIVSILAYHDNRANDNAAVTRQYHKYKTTVYCE